MFSSNNPLNTMNIARVFPRRTNLTPDDANAYVGLPDLLTPHYDEVRISVTFSYDKTYAEQLAVEWERYADKILLGGIAYGDPGSVFIPGEYVKFGAVMTSRGCPNSDCFFCDVPDREGDIRELPITMGWNLLDSNILACSETHIRAVFEMFKICKREYHQPILLTGGLEAKRLKYWHVELIKEVKPKYIFFANDTPDDYEYLVLARKILTAFEIPACSLRCYVLIGYQGDTIGQAEKRLRQTLDLGYVPMAMLYRDLSGKVDKTWSKFQRLWVRPGIINSKFGGRM